MLVKNLVTKKLMATEPTKVSFIKWYQAIYMVSVFNIKTKFVVKEI